jgi:hypothetical protein
MRRGATGAALLTAPLRIPVFVVAGAAAVPNTRSGAAHTASLRGTTYKGPCHAFITP